ncbi:MAG: hypothetical protein KDK71_01050 [Chlamydiia bacterium]|nr:hypothetical protein [Chlamydiia bacterium]
MASIAFPQTGLLDPYPIFITLPSGKTRTYEISSDTTPLSIKEWIEQDAKSYAARALKRVAQGGHSFPRSADFLRK